MEETKLPILLVSREETEKKIQDQIDKGQQLGGQQINTKDELDKAQSDFESWSDFNKKLLSKLFNNSSITDEYVSISVVESYAYPTLDSLKQEIDWWQKKVGSRINCLQSICEQLELYDGPSNIPQSTTGDEVFIVHGRDDGTKETVARFVEKFNLKATILHEQPSSQKTIIEKLEKYADNAGFAIVLLTPDDVGALKDKIEEESKPRARQNVVFELGYFIGKLGRERVFPLLKGNIEKPSDIDGVICVPMDEAWKLRLAKEMRAAGLSIDMNKI